MRDKEDPGALGGATGAQDTSAAGSLSTTGPPAGASPPLVLLITPVGAEHWKVVLQDTAELVLARTKLPFCAGARRLLEMGFSPEQFVTMRRPAGVACFVPIKLAVAAKLTVEENDRGIRFRRWRDPALRLRGVGESSAGAAEGDAPVGDTPAGAEGPEGEDAP